MARCNIGYFTENLKIHKEYPSHQCRPVVSSKSAWGRGAPGFHGEVTRIEAPRRVGHWDWCLPPQPTKSRGGSRSTDWGHIGPYGERRARAYNWRLCGVQQCPGAKPLVRRSGGEAPWSWTLFYVVICLKWNKAAMFMSCFMSCFMVINDGDCQRQLSFNFFYPWPLGPPSVCPE